MIGMYTIWWLHVAQGVTLWIAFPAAVLLVALGLALHYFIIRPVLAAEPINQLLVTGGVLFFLQALATVVFGIDFRNLGVRLGSANIINMSFSWARILASASRLQGCWRSGYSSPAPTWARRSGRLPRTGRSCLSWASAARSTW